MRIVSLNDSRATSPNVAGNKAAVLARLTQEGFRVPRGFAICTAVFDEFVAWARVQDALRARAEDDPVETSNALRTCFREAAVPAGLFDEALTAFRVLRSDRAAVCAVRSSAVGEDNSGASFAGQHESILGISEEGDMVRAVIECWSSLFTPSAILYRARTGRGAEGPRMGVIVQEIIEADVSGVLFTIDPVTGHPGDVCIESAYGLGIGIGNGLTDPDFIRVDKWGLRITADRIGAKALAWRWCDMKKQILASAVPPEDQKKLSLSPEEVTQLVNAALSIERRMREPQDIEWALLRHPGGSSEIFIIQARPVGVCAV